MARLAGGHWWRPRPVDCEEAVRQGRRGAPATSGSQVVGGRSQALEQVLSEKIDGIYLSIVASPFGGTQPFSHALVVLKGFRRFFRRTERLYQVDVFDRGLRRAGRAPSRARGGVLARPLPARKVYTYCSLSRLLSYELALRLQVCALTLPLGTVSPRIPVMPQPHTLHRRHSVPEQSHHLTPTPLPAYRRPRHRQQPSRGSPRLCGPPAPPHTCCRQHPTPVSSFHMTPTAPAA